jgi:hypothetical protein
MLHDVTVVEGFLHVSRHTVYTFDMSGDFFTYRPALLDRHTDLQQEIFQHDLFIRRFMKFEKFLTILLTACVIYGTIERATQVLKLLPLFLNMSCFETEKYNCATVKAIGAVVSINALF